MRFTTQQRVRFAETDAAGIVHYANYLPFFEVARSEAVRHVGLPDEQVLAAELHAPVLEARLHYRAPARFDDVLLLQTWIAEISESHFTFAYEIRQALDQTLVATGETVHAWTEVLSSVTTLLPNWIRAALEQLRSDS